MHAMYVFNRYGNKDQYLCKCTLKYYPLPLDEEILYKNLPRWLLSHSITNDHGLLDVVLLAAEEGKATIGHI